MSLTLNKLDPLKTPVRLRNGTPMKIVAVLDTPTKSGNRIIAQNLEGALEYRLLDGTLAPASPYRSNPTPYDLVNEVPSPPNQVSSGLDAETYLSIINRQETQLANLRNALKEYQAGMRRIAGAIHDTENTVVAIGKGN